jgi:hypothetical protein
MKLRNSAYDVIFVRNFPLAKNVHKTSAYLTGHYFHSLLFHILLNARDT